VKAVQMNEFSDVRFPADCRGVIDVTQPPYCLDNTGREDCTQKLREMIDSIMQQQLDGIEATRQHLLSIPEPTANVAFENRKVNGVVTNVLFPENEPLIPALYFPNGTYLVSDTISYTLDNLQNHCPGQAIRGYELNRQLMMIGQSRDGTVIKLKDHCPGFEFGNERPVISYMRGERSNVAWSNFFENITIDVGVGNPGAVGLVFFGNNSGAVRNVTIRSSDPEGRGAYGFGAIHEIISGCCVRGLRVEGFDTGIQVLPTRNFVAMAHIELINQRKYGIRVEQTIASFHDVHIEGNVPAVFVAGALANVVLTDVEAVSEGCIYPAIRIDLGCAFIRNLKTKGYAKAVSQYWGEKTLPDGCVEEFTTHEGVSMFGDEVRSVHIPDVRFPDEAGMWDGKWTCVNDFGAVGDGVTDDTEAVQAAMNEGGIVWFQPGRYFLSRTIEIPPQVRHVHFMTCDLAIPEERREAEGDALFSVTGNGGDMLLIEKLKGRHHIAGGIRAIRHDGTRPLYLRDMHTQCCPCYFNTVPGGTVYMEDVVGTTAVRKYRQQPCFHFIGQKAYGLCLNPERSAHEIINDGGSLWLMGFKTEGDGPLCETFNGGTTDILGGTISIGTNGLRPIIYNEESDVSAVLATNGYGTQNIFPVAVEEIREGKRRVLLHNELPQRFAPFYRMPLYVGRAKNENKSYGVYDLY